MPSSDSIENEEIEMDILASLLNGTPFKIKSQEEKIAILKKGRPLPQLSISQKDKSCNKTFQTSLYSIHNWLCASQSYNKFFCWPCTLMRPETSSWCSTGNDDIKRLNSLAIKHTVCKSHLKAIAEYDAILISVGLSPEFIDNNEIACKDEDELSNQSEVDIFNTHLEDSRKSKTATEGNDKVKIQTEVKPDNETESRMHSKLKTKISFKTWQELNKDLLPVSRTKYFEDLKLFRWKRRIARQEFKNAKLLGEKLKIEIEVLKAKAEYLKSIKSEVTTLEPIKLLPALEAADV